MGMVAEAVTWQGGPFDELCFEEQVKKSRKFEHKINISVFTFLGKMKSEFFKTYFQNKPDGGRNLEELLGRLKVVYWNTL